VVSTPSTVAPMKPVTTGISPRSSIGFNNAMDLLRV
jgi:hypothetical protein